MALSAISGLANVAAARPALPTLPTPAVGAPAASPSSFGDMFTGALDSMQKTQATADNLANKVATGSMSDVHDYMIAATEASLSTELTVAVRNKAVEAFQSIMSMQI
jgi:flagellar hook-basal body complex protein FliE